MRLIGAALSIWGFGLAVRSALLLSGRGRSHRGDTPDFVLAGPYLRTRNPLLTGFVAAVAGVALIHGGTSWMFASLGAAVGAHWWVTRIEEPRLRTRFGEYYRAYCQRVPRWGLRARQSITPDRVLIDV